MSIPNISALLNMYREKGVISARTHLGQIVFFGLGRLTKSQREMLMDIPKSKIDAAMKWQGR